MRMITDNLKLEQAAVGMLGVRRRALRYLRTAMLLVFWGGVLFLPCIARAENRGLGSTDARPNIVMIFVDDLGQRDLGCYGSEFYDTPNIDRLAKSGAQFEQFYSAHPVCSPTRAALMTGKSPQRVGITQWIPQPSAVHLPHSETTIAEALKSAGYRTAYIGKWHLGEANDQQPSQHGFDWQRGVNRAGSPGSYFFPFKRKAKQNKKGKQNEKSYWDVPDFDQGQQGDYLTDKLTDAAIEFVSLSDDNEDNEDKPFFLCLAHYAVHTPIQSPKLLTERYRKKRDRQFGETELSLIPENNNSASRPRQDNPAYASMVSNLDSNVGRILQCLEEKELMENTVVVFTSDNGGLSTLKSGRVGPTSCRPMRAGKGWNYEGGIRIPTLISWPGRLPSGHKIEQPAITMDLYPTILELAGLELNPRQHIDGMSLMPLLQKSPQPEVEQRFLAWHYPHNHGSGHTPSSALRRGDYKLLIRQGQAAHELYDLSEDPSEQNDLSQQNPELTAELADLLQRWIETTSQNE